MAKHRAVDLLIRINIKRRARLFKERPEKHLNDDQDQCCEDPITLLRLQFEDRLEENVAQGQGAGRIKNKTHRSLVADHEPHDQGQDRRTDIDKVLAADPSHRRGSKFFGIARLTSAIQQRLAADEDHETGKHTNTGQAKAVAPAEGLAQVTRQGSTAEGTEVDTHIVEREALIAPFVGLLVKLANQRRDVRLQETDAHRDEG